MNLINGAIENAVHIVNAQNSTTRLHYVDVNDGAFVGHDICSSDSYFNGIDVFNPEYSLHPNNNGHIAYAEDFLEVIS
ncbi:MAG TPA: hypothetical protein VFT59_03785 [Candidatus Saccharimonadales bacterium]|nr:hypothetical protein [Candidatus Saccharimonadales bacterium]